MKKSLWTGFAVMVCGILAMAFLLTGSAATLGPILMGRNAVHPAAPAAATVRVPILMYHALTENPGEVSDMVMTQRAFQQQMAALAQAGYTTVNYDDLAAYVRRGVPLPKRAVVLTFDDGYADTLTLAAPVLQTYGFQAQVAVIGVSLGKAAYKQTGQPIRPHFSLQQARPWLDRGVLRLNCHSFDLHQTCQMDGKSCRKGVLPLPGERREDYERMLKADYRQWLAQIPQGDRPGESVYTYPYGKASPWSEEVLHGLGVTVTVGTRQAVAQLVRGEAQSLSCLPRLTVTQQVTPQALLKLLH